MIQKLKHKYYNLSQKRKLLKRAAQVKEHVSDAVIRRRQIRCS